MKEIKTPTAEGYTYTSLKENILKYIPFLFLAILLLFIGITAYKILEPPHLFFNEQESYLGITKYFLVPPLEGRFYPFIHLEFYPLFKSSLSLDNLAFSFYLMQAIKFVSFSILFIYILNFYTKNFYLSFLSFAAFFFTVKPLEFIPTFAHTLFAEPLIMLCCTLFLFFYYLANKTDKILLYLLSFLSMSYAFYLKEPVFSSFAVFSLMKLIFFKEEMTKKEIYFHSFILVNCLLYITLCFVLAYPGGQSSTYLIGRPQEDYANFLSIVLLDYKLILPLLLTWARLIFVTYKRVIILEADMFLLMGVAYLSCCAILCLEAGHFFLPSAIFFSIAYGLYLKEVFNKYKNFLSHFAVFSAILLAMLVLGIEMLKEPLNEDYSYSIKPIVYERGYF